MATTTPNFGWPVPTSTDLVKDGATAIEALGDSIDASLLDLKGGTSGQVLAKNSNTDMDFIWVTDAAGDITGVTAGTGISGGGTSGTVTITNSMATAIDAKGDLIAGTGADAFSRLPIGTNGQILTADSAESTGIKWATPGTGALTLIKTQTIGTTVSSVTVTDAFSSTYDSYKIVLTGGVASITNQLQLKLGSTTSGYSLFQVYGSYSSSTVAGSNYNNLSIWGGVGAGSTNSLNMDVTVLAPNLAKNTHFSSSAATAVSGGNVFFNAGFLADTTQYTAFTIEASSGTLTGGTIRVYGYQNS